MTVDKMLVNQTCCLFMLNLHAFPSRGRQPAAISRRRCNGDNRSERKVNRKLLRSSEQTKSFIGSTVETLCFNTVSFVGLDSSIIRNGIKMSLITASDAERQGLCFTSHLETSEKLTSALHTARRDETFRWHFYRTLMFLVVCKACVHIFVNHS